MAGMMRREGELTNPLGLHLREATRFVELSTRFQARVKVCCKGRTADGGSVLDLLMLGAGHGDRVELEATGPDADEAAAALFALIEGQARSEA